MIIIELKMNKEYMKELSLLLDVANQLNVCALKNCNETTIKVKENKELAKSMAEIMIEKDINKKKKLIEKIAKNKDIIDNELCLFKHCKVVYEKLLDVLISIFKKFAEKMPKNDNMFAKLNEMFEEIKKLITKDKLTKKDLIHLQQHKMLLMSMAMKM